MNLALKCHSKNVVLTPRRWVVPGVWRDTLTQEQPRLQRHLSSYQRGEATSFGKSVGSRLCRGSTWRTSGAGHRLEETIPAFPLPDPICVVMRGRRKALEAVGTHTRSGIRLSVCGIVFDGFVVVGSVPLPIPSGGQAPSEGTRVSIRPVYRLSARSRETSPRVVYQSALMVEGDVWYGWELGRGFRLRGLAGLASRCVVSPHPATLATS